MEKRILMVCLGNICRSPLAEGIMQREIERRNLPWEVDSAGTSNFHTGERPDARSVDIARKNGIDITHQRSRQLRLSDLKAFDHILVMDSSNYQSTLTLDKSGE